MTVRERLNNILLDDNVCKKINENLEFILVNIPEIISMIGFEHKHPHHHLDVYMHTLKSLEKSPKDLSIRMALLFHDIGKPFSCQEINGIRHFRGHPGVSANMTQVILERLNYDEKFISDVVYLVKMHDDIIRVNNLDNDLDLVKKRLEMQFCDAMAHHPDKIEKRLKLLNDIKEKLYKIER